MSSSYSSPLAQELAPGLLERFERYVRIESTAQRDRTQSPSTPGQLEVGRLLVAELQAAGVDDAMLDDNGYVVATLPATVEDAPTIGLVAHVDTSPDAPGAGVQPLVHRDYDGTAIRLPKGDTVLDPADMRALADKVGHDLVTSSGDTLLGADDKAGVAEIMAAVAHLAAHPELPRPTLKIAFTPDEEIGEGATLFDIETFGALCAYTMDGSERG
ncbi:MAG: pepT, partial [Conexibacter sp.]|nr:pepT [Conexibacter sp.]